MNLKEEIESVHFILKMCEALFNNKSKIYDFSIDFGDGKELSLDFTDEDFLSVRWRSSHNSPRTVIFHFADFDYYNHRANGMWSLSFNQNGELYYKYSILHSGKSALIEDENYIDTLCEGGREMTEEEYFQACLIHPDMPETYDDMLLIIRTLRESRGKYNMFNIGVAMYFNEYTTMELLRKIRRQLMFKLGINFL